VIADPLERASAPAPAIRTTRTRAEPRPSPRRTVAAPAPGTVLTVVPRRRRAAGFAVAFSLVLAGLMLGAAVLHTSLAERQLEIDRLERGVTAAQERFDVLRRERAELRSPTRLSEEAERLGMYPANASLFVPVDGLTLALVIASTGEVLDDVDQIENLEPLDQFRLVKSVSGATP
jgi:hypothetical protein